MSDLPPPDRFGRPPGMVPAAGALTLGGIMRTTHQTERTRARAQDQSDGAGEGERRRDGDARAEEPASVRDAGQIESSRRAAVLQQLTLTFVKNRETRTVVRFDVQVQGGQIVGFAVLRKSTLERINNPHGFKVVLNPP
jgi:hypothetical protein